MLDGDKISDKALQDAWLYADYSGVRGDWRKKVRRVLNALDIAVAPSELAIPGYKFHALTGDRKGTFAVSISKNWRITFRWDDAGPYDVKMEDYHGR